MRNLINNINKKDFIFYKNLCITNNRNRNFNKVYKNNLNFNKVYKNNLNFNKVYKNNLNFNNNIDENVSELHYLEQIYDCIDHIENINKEPNEKINK